VRPGEVELSQVRIENLDNGDRHEQSLGARDSPTGRLRVRPRAGGELGAVEWVVARLVADGVLVGVVGIWNFPVGRLGRGWPADVGQGESSVGQHSPKQRQR
jgi:hypothetical protein